MSTVRDDSRPTIATPLIEDSLREISQQKWRENSDTRALFICAIFVFIVEFASLMQLAPTNQLLEFSVCRSYYRSTDPSLIPKKGVFQDVDCKLQEIQSAVAIWRGWLGLAEAAPGLLLAIPYGIMAQFYGTKAVVALGLGGEIINTIWIWVAFHYCKNLSVWVVVLSGSFQCIGGGSSVLSSMVLAMAVKFVSPHSRIRLFFYMAVGNMVSGLLSAPLSSLLMSQYGPDIPYLLGISLQIAAYLALYLLPNSEELSDMSEDSIDESEFEDRYSSLPKARFVGVTHMKEIFYYLFSRPILILLLLALAVNKLSRQLGELIIQYTRVRYDWTIAQGGYLLAWDAAIKIVLSCSVLPWVHRYLLVKHEWNATKADLLMAKGSNIFLVLGSLVIGLSLHPPGLIFGLLLFLMGSGYTHAMRSYLTSAFPPAHITLLYASISLVDALGSLVAAPLLGYMLAVGIEIGGMAQGLPFLLSSVLYAVTGIALWCAHINSTEGV